MWWALLAMWGTGYAHQSNVSAGANMISVQSVAAIDAIETDAGAEPDAQPDADDVLKKRSPEMLATLSGLRREEVRCAMLAGLIMYEFKRGASTKSYGLTEAKTDILLEQLSAKLVAKQGWSAVEVRAVYNADFERFSAGMYAEDPNAPSPEQAFAAAVGRCQPLYASIDVAGKTAGISPE